MSPDFNVSHATKTDNSQQDKLINPSGHSHSFDTGIAAQLGVNAAIVFNHIVYWLRINKKKNQNFHDGKTWMYETISQISDFLGYLSEKQVRTAIKYLVDAKVLLEGFYNKNKFDRTTWYCLKDESIIQDSKSNYEKTWRAEEETPRSLHKDTQVSCIIQEENNKNTQEQQQTQVAAAIEIFDCLKTIDIPEYEKVWLCKNHTEKDIEGAIAWSQLPETKIKKSLTAAIKWACENKIGCSSDAVAISKEHEHRKHAISLENSVYCEKARFLALNDHCEIIRNDHVNPICFSYEDSEFIIKLAKELAKQGFQKM